MHALLAAAERAGWEARWGRQAVHQALSAVLAQVRAQLGAGEAVPAPEALLERAAAVLERDARPRLRRVLNATGTVLHTGLGRAPLAPAALAAVLAHAAGYSNLEYDLGQGTRGSRHALVAEALCALTGAEAAMVVNNNAAAVLLLLAALAAGREVVVSRGELVEIGGSFRVPDIMAQSGARLREVGTTNRTYARDYAGVIGPETALLLRVHQSNFAQIGFTASPDLAELVSVGAAAALPVAYDMGSGALVPVAYGGRDEPDARAALAAGVDVVTFSGDKLLGGPQAGILCGRARWIARCAQHPLARAVRVDKLTLAALEATLELYRRGRAEQEVPALRLLGRGPAELRRACARLARRLAAGAGDACAISVVPTTSVTGAGALPGVELPGYAVSLLPAAASAQQLADALRLGDPPVVARLHGERLLLDPRTILDPAEERLLVTAVLGAIAELAPRTGG